MMVMRLPLYYDPMIAKACANSKTRLGAIINMRRILSEFIFLGIKTNIPFHQSVMKNKTFIKGIYDTGFIDNKFDIEDMQRRKELDHNVPIIAASIRQLLSEKKAAHSLMTEEEAQQQKNLWKQSARLQNLQKIF